MGLTSWPTLMALISARMAFASAPPAELVRVVFAAS